MRISVGTFTTAGIVQETTCATGTSVEGAVDPADSGAPVAGELCWPAWIVQALATRPRTTSANVALERIFIVGDALLCSRSGRGRAAGTVPRSSHYASRRRRRLGRGRPLSGSSQGGGRASVVRGREHAVAVHEGLETARAGDVAGRVREDVAVEHREVGALADLDRSGVALAMVRVRGAHGECAEGRREIDPLVGEEHLGVVDTE